MIPSFLITFREVIEASLIVATISDASMTSRNVIKNEGIIGDNYNL